jgi:hypothetical protein
MRTIERFGQCRHDWKKGPRICAAPPNTQPPFHLFPFVAFMNRGQRNGPAVQRRAAAMLPGLRFAVIML